jgi:hypothetical protein
VTLLKYARKTEFGRSLLPSIFLNLIHLFGKNGRLIKSIYPEIIQEFLTTEISAQGLTKELKKAIAGCLP